MLREIKKPGSQAQAGLIVSTSVDLDGVGWADLLMTRILATLFVSIVLSGCENGVPIERQCWSVANILTSEVSKTDSLFDKPVDGIVQTVFDDSTAECSSLWTYKLTPDSSRYVVQYVVFQADSSLTTRLNNLTDRSEISDKVKAIFKMSSTDEIQDYLLKLPAEPEADFQLVTNDGEITDFWFRDADHIVLEFRDGRNYITISGGSIPIIISKNSYGSEQLRVIQWFKALSVQVFDSTDTLIYSDSYDDTFRDDEYALAMYQGARMVVEEEDEETVVGVKAINYDLRGFRRLYDYAVENVGFPPMFSKTN